MLPRKTGKSRFSLAANILVTLTTFSSLQLSIISLNCFQAHHIIRFHSFYRASSYAKNCPEIFVTRIDFYDFYDLLMLLQ